MMRLDLYDNSWYKAGPRWKIALWYAVSVTFFRTAIPYPSKFKVFMLRIFGAKIGRNVIIKPSVIIKYPWKLSIGDHSWVGEQVWIDNLDLVTIGNQCCISQGAMLLCGNHNYKKPAFDLMIKPIVLEDGVWIGAKCLVGPGCILKKGAILSLGSVCTVNLEASSINQGNPAVLIRKREKNGDSIA